MNIKKNKIVSPSLERLYLKLKRHLILAQSYTEVKNLYFIFKACRLRPYDYFTNKINYKLILFRHWFDEFGNSVFIQKNKHMRIIFNDLSLDQNKITCTDMYYGLSLDKICKMSKLFFINCIEFQNEKNIFISFLGLDDYLRTYAFTNNEWIQVSSLYLGWKHIKNIIKNINIKDFNNFSIKEDYDAPCAIHKQWISLLPSSSNFLKLMKKEFGDILWFFNNFEKKENNT